MNILTEVFVHGSYCISFSGICYFSSVLGGNSGNRGRCSQPCRDRYETTAAGKNYPLNLKDNSAYFDLQDLTEAGVSSLKIEGRIKNFGYVFTVVKVWRKLLHTFYDKNELVYDNRELFKVFNRDFSNAYLKGAIGKDMFIDNPRDHSVKHLSEMSEYASNSECENDQRAFYDEKEKTKVALEDEIKKINIEKAPLKIDISGRCDEPLKVSVQTPENEFDVFSEIALSNRGAQLLDYEMILKRFKTFNDTEYYIEQIHLEQLANNLYIPFKELTSIKRRILFILNNSKEFVDPVKIPLIKKESSEKIKPSLSVLISSTKDISICNETSATVYFQLPDCIKNKYSEFVDLFNKNKKLKPWFPSVLIGEDFTAAVEFLQEVQPSTIVTNNLGIAYEAYVKGIPWIAGPYLNVVNSYSLLALKEYFNCSGSFISNEINKNQILRINKPDNFKLYYSIYHPILLMTSRQCLFQQVTGCEKSRVDNSCIENCKQSSTITNLEKHMFFIEKSKGNYHRVYHETNFMNLDVIHNIPDLFSGFFIDLSDVKTKTQLNSDKLSIIKCFESFIMERSHSNETKTMINQMIYPTTSNQYKKGI